MSTDSIRGTDAEFGSEAQIEAFGVPGTAGSPAGEIRRAREAPLWINAIWHPAATLPDTHVGFSGQFFVSESGRYRIAIQATASFRLWIDGSLIAWGPFRYAPALPEIAWIEAELHAGPHRIAAHVASDGLNTRISAAVPPFLFATLENTATGESLPISWRCRVLAEFSRTSLRVSPLQGWMEWQDRPFDRSWINDGPAGDDWIEACSVEELRGVLGHPTMADTPLPDQLPLIQPRLIDSGLYRETFPGYRWDDPGPQFLLADRSPRLDDDADGTYWVFDLERIRIGALELEIECEGRTEVTIGYGERVGPDGHVSPIVALSAGATRFIQHYTVDAQHAVIEPLQPLGARYLEVRLSGEMNARLKRVVFRERDYLGEPGAALSIGDRRLEKIWSVGLDTLRASAEDSLVDSVRERGEWVGDVVTAGMELSIVGWARVDHVRRALIHGAAGARADGLVAGCGPGELLYLGTYAAQWNNAVVRCAELEGSTSLLHELEESGRANTAALIEAINEDGTTSLPWPFVDWGYRRPVTGPDRAVLAHVLRAVDAWRTWQERLGHSAETLPGEDRVRAIITATLKSGSYQRDALAYHSRVLGVFAGLGDRLEAAEISLRHIRSSFPFDVEGARLRDCTEVSEDASTPYFTNYSMRLIIEQLGVETAEDIWRAGWGWMLDRGARTWWEVFDDRWSQCHYWTGAPTWQLSRSLLGVDATWHNGGSAVSLAVRPGRHNQAGGILGVTAGVFAEIEWQRGAEGLLHYSITPSKPIKIVTADGTTVELSASRHDLVLKSRSPGVYSLPDS